VFPGDVLSMRHEVTEARGMATRAGVGLVRSRWEVLNQHGQTVMTMEGWGMYRRRHPSPAGEGDAGAAPGPAP
jgi:acyl dehydratase